jgi:hypothetical protein
VSREHEPPREAEEPYWQSVQRIGEAPIRGEPTGLWLRLHISDEPYYGQRELVPLSRNRGNRTYIHAQPFILEPQLSLTMALDPAPTPNGVIGTVIASEWEGMRHVQVGNAQGWAYPADRLLVVWEAFLWERHSQPDPRQDAALTVLWQGFEQLLCERFPAATRLVTPSWENIYEREAWQEFLRARGYAPFSQRAFMKERAR